MRLNLARLFVMMLMVSLLVLPSTFADAPQIDESQVTLPKESRSSDVLVTLLYPGALVYAGCCSSGSIFQPPKATYRDSGEIIKLTTKDNTKISATYSATENAKYTILFSHGNAEDLGTTLPFLKMLKERGFSVFAYDYHGYGTSEGKPSEKKVYSDINAAFQYLTKDLNIPADKIVLMGFSLGTAPSVDLATREKVAGLVLTGAFKSAFRIITRVPLPFNKFKNDQKIDKVKCPILFIHGKKDDIVHPINSLELYKKAKSKKKIVFIDDANHNDLVERGGETYWNALKEFSLSLETLEN